MCRALVPQKNDRRYDKHVKRVKSNLSRYTCACASDGSNLALSLVAIGTARLGGSRNSHLHDWQGRHSY